MDPSTAPPHRGQVGMTSTLSWRTLLSYRIDIVVGGERRYPHTQAVYRFADKQKDKSMRRPQLLQAMALIAGLVCCAVCRAALEIDPPSFYAGDVRAGAALSHRFTLTNRGSDAVEIIAVRPSCGCTTATPDRRRFEPGESGSLLLEVNTLTQPDGPGSWRVTLLCKSGEIIEEKSLSLTARVQADIMLEPTALVIVTEGAVSREITLSDRRPHPLTVVKVETTSPQVRARIDEPSRGADGRWKCVVHLETPADLADGRHEESLHLYTSDPEYPELKMPFTVVKRSRQRVSATPAAVELTADGSPSRLVLLRGGDDDMVEIEGVDVDDAALRCEWSPGSRPTGALRVRVDPAKLTAESLKAMVHIRLSKPVAQTVDVPVTWAPR
jgi:hypothetical protein